MIGSEGGYLRAAARPSYVDTRGGSVHHDTVASGHRVLNDVAGLERCEFGYIHVSTPALVVEKALRSGTLVARNHKTPCSGYSTRLPARPVPSKFAVDRNLPG